MYISSVHLCNWRSYRDAHFRFKPPTRRRPLVLIGAMNGHGKTSFLLGLYLGLFGRFGLRHAEGFSTFRDEDWTSYRQAITKFRRNSAPSDEPTTIELTFTPTADEVTLDVKEVRVTRRWFFSADGRPKQGDAFEEVQLHIDGRPQTLSLVDAAHDRIERRLFPASFMPAFFFDGEQAQTLITNSGDGGLKKSVEVLFGTKILEDVEASIKQFINQSRNRIGGTRTVTAQQRELDEKLREREELEARIADLQRQIGDVSKSRSDFEKQQQSLKERLSRLGADSRGNVEEILEQIARTDQELLAAEKALEDHALSLGTALAVARLAPAMINRLNAEQVREQWERLREGTINRTNEVLAVALPEPPDRDDLLGHLTPSVRKRVRERFSLALEQIYHPPPVGCATEYRIGHVKGEMRERLQELVSDVCGINSREIQATARRVKQAREAKQDAENRRARISNIPREAQELTTALNEVVQQLGDASGQLWTLEKEVESRKAALHALNGDIGQLQEHIESLEPEQKRIAIAERVRCTLDTLTDELRPITLRRMQETVTDQFSRIGDRRFRDMTIEFHHGAAPLLRRSGSPDQLIETMSGFERRSFGIAFSLALAEMTQRRIPLVIDTPLGNADTEYRPRLLKALTNVELDQIIILTHDAEITHELFEAIESQVQQTILVQFDQEKGESVAVHDSFFNGVRA